MANSNSPEHGSTNAECTDKSNIPLNFSLNTRTTHVAVTAGQLRVVQTIQMMIQEGREPSIRAIAGRVNLSQSGVQKYVSRLRRIGVIAEEGYAVRRAPTGVMLMAQVVGWST